MLITRGLVRRWRVRLTIPPRATRRGRPHLLELKMGGGGGKLSVAPGTVAEQLQAAVVRR